MLIVIHSNNKYKIILTIQTKYSFSNVFGINQSPTIFTTDNIQPNTINIIQLSVAINTFELKIVGAEEVVVFQN